MSQHHREHQPGCSQGTGLCQCYFLPERGSCWSAAAVTEIWKPVTTTKSQGPVLRSRTGATGGIAGLSQLFHREAPPRSRRKSPPVAAQTGCWRNSCFFSHSCAATPTAVTGTSCQCSPGNERGKTLFLMALLWQSLYPLFWVAASPLQTEASCISFQYKYKPASFLFSQFSPNYKLDGKNT